jgi:hypothetical protein
VILITQQVMARIRRLLLERIFVARKQPWRCVRKRVQVQAAQVFGKATQTERDMGGVVFTPSARKRPTSLMLEMVGWFTCLWEILAKRRLAQVGRAGERQGGVGHMLMQAQVNNAKQGIHLGIASHTLDAARLHTWLLALEGIVVQRRVRGQIFIGPLGRLMQHVKSSATVTLHVMLTISMAVCARSMYQRCRKLQLAGTLFLAQVKVSPRPQVALAAERV